MSDRPPGAANGGPLLGDIGETLVADLRDALLAERPPDQDEQAYAAGLSEDEVIRLLDSHLLRRVIHRRVWESLSGLGSSSRSTKAPDAAPSAGTALPVMLTHEMRRPSFGAASAVASGAGAVTGGGSTQSGWTRAPPLPPAPDAAAACSSSGVARQLPSEGGSLAVTEGFSPLGGILARGLSSSAGPLCTSTRRWCRRALRRPATARPPPPRPAPTRSRWTSPTNPPPPRAHSTRSRSTCRACPCLTRRSKGCRSSG